MFSPPSICRIYVPMPKLVMLHPMLVSSSYSWMGRTSSVHVRSHCSKKFKICSRVSTGLCPYGLHHESLIATALKLSTEHSTLRTIIHPKHRVWLRNNLAIG